MCRFEIGLELVGGARPGVVLRMPAARRPVDGERRQGRCLEIIADRTDAAIADDVERTGRRQGGDRKPAGERLDQHEAERVGPARKDEDIGPA